MTMPARSVVTGTPDSAEGRLDLAAAAQVGGQLLAVVAETAEVDDPLQAGRSAAAPERRRSGGVLVLEVVVVQGVHEVVGGVAAGHRRVERVGVLDVGADRGAEPGPAAPRLHALMVSDVTQLCASRWNLGALYLLPELRLDRFEQFRLRRAELRTRYRTLAAEVIAECDGPADADDLPFRLVESVINRRSDDSGCADEQPWVIADGALRTLGFDGDFAALRKLTGGRLGLADTVQV